MLEPARTRELAERMRMAGLSSFLGRNASCCDFKQLFPGLAGVALHCGTGVSNNVSQKHR